ncbi:MAG TPA: hypothetical protein VH352_28175 [Pseudonocardiaceae bacterium]|jgi:hypothetical protein|nr:hypothetical protein [Pseudonocardiaceae bacterium]
MRLTLPPDVTIVDLTRPDHAVPRLAAALNRIRDRPSLVAETEVLARQMIEETTRAGGYLLAVLSDGAILTGANVPGAADWSREHTNALRWRLDDTGHETVTIETPLGPVVVAEWHTGNTAQLQAFLMEPGCCDVVVITLTAWSSPGWPAHRTAFLDLVHTVDDQDCATVIEPWMARREPR